MQLNMQRSDQEKEQGETVLSSEVIYSGRVVKFTRKQIRLPTGKTAVREIIDHPGSVGIVPILDDESQRVVLIRQFRLAARGTIWEIPAGTMEEGESPEASARRELEEETGYRCRALDPLFECYLAPGYSAEVMHFFLAKNLVKTRTNYDEDETISVHYATLEEIFEMIERGEIRDAKTVAAISYLVARERLREARP